MTIGFQNTVNLFESEIFQDKLSGECRNNSVELFAFNRDGLSHGTNQCVGKPRDGVYEYSFEQVVPFDGFHLAQLTMDMHSGDGFAGGLAHELSPKYWGL